LPDGVLPAGSRHPVGLPRAGGGPSLLGEAALPPFRAASQNEGMTMSWTACHLVVWPNSTSNALPVGGITVPSGRVICPVKVPVTVVTTVIQSPPPNWMG